MPSSSIRFIRPATLVLGLLSAGGAQVADLVAQAPAITFRQSNNDVPQTPQTTVTVTYKAAQTAGSLNVVVVGWSDSTRQVTAVTDLKGNAYALAAAPTVQAGIATQVIYYAANIAAAAAGANAVTVTFNGPANYPDVRIAEYSGLDPVNPLDVAVGASGTSTQSNSGSISTTYPNDLLVGANLVQSKTTGSGTGYTNRVITRPDGDILEDRIVTATGSYSATAPVSPSAPWIMQMVAFRAAGGGGGDSQAPTAPAALAATAAGPTQISLSWTASTDNVGVTGYRVERCQGAGCSSFAQVATPAGTSYSDSGLTASTPYSYRVRATDAAGNLSGYSNVASATTLTPPDTTPPTAPSALVLTVVSISQINLAWTASTDAIGVMGYRVERCAGAGCATFAEIGTPTVTSFNSTGLAASTSYSYRVRATDAAGNLSGYSNVPSATTLTPPDTTPPTAPSALVLTVVSISQINLAWTASTDAIGVTGYRVEQCAGAGCATFAEIGTPTATSFSSSGLAAATSNSYRVRATDAAGNLSGYSNVASATTLTAPDTTPPTAPSALVLTVISSSQINLAWTASTDATGVTGYRVERCAGAGCATFAEIGTPTATSFNSTGLAASTSYSYRVRATDAAGNLSGYSNVASATTLAPPDTTPPTAPSALVLTVVSISQINLAWTASTDAIGVTGYRVERCAGAGCATFAEIGTPTATSFNSTGLAASTSYSYRVRATDAAGNLSGYSNVASATTLTPPDTTPPTAPSTLVLTVISSSQINLAWTASTDAIGVTGYRVERCAGPGCATFAEIGTPTVTSFNSTGLAASTSYSYRVRATDAAGNLSGYSNVASATTLTPPDTTPPTAPSALVLTVISSSQINLAWTASTDATGVTGYRVERCAGPGCATFAEIGTPTVTSFNSTGLAAATSYSYRVRATDAAGNLSGYSNVASATTLTPPDTTPPTAPSALVLTVISSSQINLAWTASTDAIGVTGYRVERCAGAGCATFAEIGTPTVTSFSSTGLATSTSYSYRVRATDAAGNLSGYSNVASATTLGPPDTTPPTAPSALVLTVVSSSQINLAWTASTDATGVTGYRVERCAGAGCATFAEIGTPTVTSFNSTGLAAATSYSYRVRASDAAGNLSSYSNVATATTQNGTAPPPITFVQVNYATPQTAQAVVTVPYTAAQTAGNLNVVIVGWSDTTRQVTSVADSRGNVYALAVGPTVQAGVATQSIYYAPGIAAAAAGANTVTVTFNGAAAYPDIRVAEYAGLDPVSPLDVAIGASGSSATSSSGTILTTSANDLLVGANLVQSFTSGAGAGFINRVVTAPDGDILEDRVVTAIGSYSATATLAPSAAWIMQMVAFRAPGQLGPAPPKLVFTAPTTGQTISGSMVNVSYVGTGDLTEVNHAHFQLDGGIVVMDLDFDGSYMFMNVPVGAHSLTGWLVRVDHSTITGTDSTVTFSTIAPDTQPPTTPSAFVATTLSSSQISLSWTASTDNTGVTGYRVERCTGAGCSGFAEIGTSTATTFVSGGLTPTTSYSYRIRAYDAAGNLSPYSTTATAITQVASGPPNILFVQGNYAAPQSSPTTVTVAYTGAQTTGNLNVVAVGWSNSTSQITSVVDTRGNVYELAAGPTVQPSIASQSIYFAANITAAAAGANSVTVTFSATAPYPDIRIAEYSGLDPVNPLDVAIGASGTSSMSNSGSISPLSPNALLVGANLVQTMTTGPGTGYTNRMITAPDGNILEDRIVSATGSYSATAPMSSGPWIMQMVAFRAAGGGSGDTQPPTVPTNLTATAVAGNQINLAWTASTDNVGVAGYRVERCQGIGCSSFSQVGATPSTSYSDTGVLATTSYLYRVMATDGVNFSGFSNIAGATTPISPPPTLTLTSPASGVNLTGTVTFTASASATAVGVQFQVDGVNVGPAVVPPFSLSFNTAQFANGSHTVGAYAWDPQKGVGTATPSTVTFTNASPGNPGQTGLWSGLFNWPLVSVHINLLSDGRVLAWDRMSSGNPEPQIWDPLTSSITAVPIFDGANLFCAGSITLPDGRLLSVGGHAADHAGLAAGRIFDPATNLWTATPDMAYPRWYPTVTTLPDGRILTLSGEVNCKGCYADTPEIYNPVTNTWSTLPAAALTIPYYPNAYVIPDGRVLVTGTAEDPIPTRVLNVATQTWTTIDARLFDSYSSAMYLPGKIMKSGTSTDSESAWTASAATAYVLDMTLPSPQWRQIASMANPRAYHVETILPDGTVLVTGGGRTIGDYDIPNAVYAAELWSPTTETWTTLASMHAPRLYHGTAILLRDGRVLISGGGRSPSDAVRDQENTEIFAPPYLFKGPRPTITSAPGQLSYGQGFTVQTPDASRISKVTLVAIGGMTHGINMSQRFLPLTFTTGAGTLNVTAPANANLAPPGIYMLFIVDNQGIPSVAATLKF